MKHPIEPDHMHEQGVGGDLRLPSGLDAEEARIFQQSIPAEEVTRDFLQELLEEHRANVSKGASAAAGH
ncbi:MAG: hypothetical protein V4684_05370 [Pseudomonadota bacterium]